MPAIHVRSVPEEVVRALKRRAARQGRSMQQEVLRVLKQAAREAPAEPPPRPIALVQVRTRGPRDFGRAEIYGDRGR